MSGGTGIGDSIDKIAGGANRKGSFFIGTVAITFGKYAYLVVNADCVFTVLQTNTDRDCLLGHDPDSDLGGGLNLATQTISKGMVIYPPDQETFLNVTLSSGSVLAYS